MAIMISRCNLHRYLSSVYSIQRSLHWYHDQVSYYHGVSSARRSVSSSRFTRSPIVNTVVRSADSSTDQSGGLREKLRSIMQSTGLSKREARTDDFALESAAIRLYIHCSKADFLRFIDKYKLPDTLGSWFKITCLHVWFVLLRSRQEGIENPVLDEDIRRAVIDALWRDARRRLDAISRCDRFLPRKTIREEMASFYSYMTTSMMELDEGIMCEDTVLAGSLWRLFYKDHNINDVVALNELVRYVRMQVHTLNNQSMADILQNGIEAWDSPLD